MNYKSYWTREAADSGMIAGYKSDKCVDERLWRNGQEYGSYVPRRNTTEGRKLAKEFDALPRYNTRELAKALGHKDVFHENYIYFFNMFFYSNGFCGFRVPVFDEPSYKKDSTLRYTPVKGLKEITWKTHNAKSAMKSKEYAATLSANPTAKTPKKKSSTTSRRSSKKPEYASSTAT